MQFNDGTLSDREGEGDVGCDKAVEDDARSQLSKGGQGREEKTRCRYICVEREFVCMLLSSE